MCAKTRQKTRSFGACSFGKTSPPIGNLKAGTKALNVHLSFENAMKLNLAIDEGVRQLNSYNRATKDGKAATVKLTIYLEKGRITVTEGKM